MSSASIKKIIPCKKNQLIEMVLDIEKYPEFVPWCIEGKVYDKSESIDLVTFKGDLKVGKSILNENTITYENSWDDSSLKVLVGWTVLKNTAEVVGATAEGFPNDVVTFNNLSLGSDPTKNQVNSSYLQRTFNSILTRINYSFKDGEFEYLLQNDNVDIEYVQIPFSTIPDSLIKLKNSDVENDAPYNKDSLAWLGIIFLLYLQ